MRHRPPALITAQPLAETALWEIAAGFSFPNGDIFERISAKGLKRCLYAGDNFPMIAALKGIQLDDIREYEKFAADLQGTFPYNYVFIEPELCASERL